MTKKKVILHCKIKKGLFMCVLITFYGRKLEGTIKASVLLSYLSHIAIIVFKFYFD